MTPGSAPGPCQSFINAASVQTQTTATLNQLQSVLEQDAYKYIGKTVIYSLAGSFYVFNTVTNKQIIAQIPMDRFEANLNLGFNSQQYGLKYKINW